MIQRVAVMVLLAVVAIGAAVILRRRRTEPPTTPTLRSPAEIDRSRFARPNAPWLVVVFTSRTCSGCAAVTEKAKGLESSSVAVQEVEYSVDTELHRENGVSAVPLVVIADSRGTVRDHFFGPVTAADLWAAVAEVRRQHPGAD